MLVRRLRAKPCVAIAYRREAYETRAGAPVRVTFDSGLRHRTARRGGAEATRSWSPTRVNRVVMEIKVHSLFPLWVRQLVQRFELEQRSIPKYLFAVEDAARDGLFSGILPGGLRALTVVHNSWRDH